MRLSLMILLFVVATGSVAASKGSGDGSVKLNVQYGLGSYLEHYTDEIYLEDQNQYISSGYSQLKTSISFEDYFSQNIHLGYSALTINPKSFDLRGELISIPERVSNFFHVSFSRAFSILTFDYGFTSMLTLEKERSRKYRFEGKEIEVHQGMQVNTGKSFPYPSFALKFFPGSRAMLDVSFLTPDANLAYGWLNAKFSYQVLPEHLVFTGTEFYNEENFGHGFKRFFQASYSVYSGYQFSPGRNSFSIKCSVLIHATDVPLDTLVPLGDRLHFEAGYGHRI